MGKLVVFCQSLAYKMMCRKRHTIGDSDSGRYLPLFFCRKKSVLSFAMSQECGVPFATWILRRGGLSWQQKSLGMSV